jgi:hypothetical protein
MTKGKLIELVYTPEERNNIDTAIPIEYWKTHDTSIYVMDYNDSIFGSLVNLKDLAKQRNIKINE